MPQAQALGGLGHGLAPEGHQLRRRCWRSKTPAACRAEYSPRDRPGGIRRGGCPPRASSCGDAGGKGHHAGLGVLGLVQLTPRGPSKQTLLQVEIHAGQRQRPPGRRDSSRRGPAPCRHAGCPGPAYRNASFMRSSSVAQAWPVGLGDQPALHTAPPRWSAGGRISWSIPAT